MIREDLIRMLVCPETRRPVSRAPGGLIAALNERVRRGALRDKGGEPVERELEDGLLRDDGLVIYPVFDGIPRMLVERAIAVDPKEVAAS
ncbi:MAG: Trm112 family protein [Verrucomicrobia bacterium]|nr:Trm112 family protein [Verrucomicrobiota bacterium]